MDFAKSFYLSYEGNEENRDGKILGIKDSIFFLFTQLCLRIHAFGMKENQKKEIDEEEQKEDEKKKLSLRIHFSFGAFYTLFVSCQLCVFDLLSSKKNVAAHFDQLLLNNLTYLKKNFVTKLKPFEFPSQLCKPHLCNFISLEAI